jgi:hypothetical protein
VVVPPAFEGLRHSRFYEPQKTRVGVGKPTARCKLNVLFGVEGGMVVVLAPNAELSQI